MLFSKKFQGRAPRPLGVPQLRYFIIYKLSPGYYCASVDAASFNANVTLEKALKHFYCIQPYDTIIYVALGVPCKISPQKLEKITKCHAMALLHTPFIL